MSVRDITVVLRTVGERTTEAARHLIRNEGIAENSIIQVSEVAPFAEALKQSFLIGIEQEKRWTMCIDADVLVRKHSIEEMVAHAENMPDNVCEIQGFVFDKFFGGPRQAGNHLYRTSLLEKAMEFIPGDESIRPEYNTLLRMSEHGFPWKTVPVVVGLHDFEQYYRDIYRKFFVHAHKHAQYIQLIRSVARLKFEKDNDYTVALRGLADGVAHVGAVSIDTRAFPSDVIPSSMNLSEKGDMSKFEALPESILSTISNWHFDKLYLMEFSDQYEILFGKKKSNKLEGYFKKVEWNQIFQRYGWFFGFCKILSMFLSVIAVKIDEFVRMKKPN